jgi:hypothetical protein
MFTNRSHTTLPLSEADRDDIVNEAVDRYVEWRRHSSACEAAYRHWAATAHSRDGALAFATFTAALDREEQAASQYEVAIRRDTTMATPRSD